MHRTSRRSILGFSKPVLFEMFNMKGRMKLSAERETGQRLSFVILSPETGTESKLQDLQRLKGLSARNKGWNAYLQILFGLSDCISAEFRTLSSEV